MPQYSDPKLSVENLLRFRKDLIIGLQGKLQALVDIDTELAELRGEDPPRHHYRIAKIRNGRGVNTHFSSYIPEESHE